MKTAGIIVVIFASTACFGACLPPLANPLLTAPYFNNVIAPGFGTAIIPPPLLNAILPPTLAPVVPLLNSIFPQGCPAQIISAILTANVPAVAPGNGIGIPAAISLLSGQSLNVPASVNLPFGFTSSNLVL